MFSYKWLVAKSLKFKRVDKTCNLCFTFLTRSAIWFAIYAVDVKVSSVTYRCKLSFLFDRLKVLQRKQFRDFPARPNVKYLLILDRTFCANKFPKILTATRIDLTTVVANFESVVININWKSQISL